MKKNYIVCTFILSVIISFGCQSSKTEKDEFSTKILSSYEYMNNGKPQDALKVLESIPQNSQNKRDFVLAKTSVHMMLSGINVKTFLNFVNEIKSKREWVLFQEIQKSLNIIIENAIGDQNIENNQAGHFLKSFLTLVNGFSFFLYELKKVPDVIPSESSQLLIAISTLENMSPKTQGDEVLLYLLEVARIKEKLKRGAYFPENAHKTLGIEPFLKLLEVFIEDIKKVAIHIRNSERKSIEEDTFTKNVEKFESDTAKIFSDAYLLDNKLKPKVAALTKDGSTKLTLFNEQISAIDSLKKTVYGFFALIKNYLNTSEEKQKALGGKL